jgi:hypothetical protein
MCEIDLNQDLLDDILVFDNGLFAVRVFLQERDSNKTYWKHHPEYEPKVPQLKQWVKGRDYNHDGKIDLFSSKNTGDIVLYKNTSTGGLPHQVSFEKIRFPDFYDSTKTVDFITYDLTKGSYGYSAVFNTPTNIPGIIDVDSDGDLDIFTFRQQQASLNWYRNLSMELTGKGDSLILDQADNCWGSFAETFANFYLDTAGCNSTLPKSKHSKSAQSRSSRHGGSTILMHDFDCNGLPDVALGDLSFSKAVVGYNHGHLKKGHITSQDTLFPKNDVPINLQHFPGLFLVDADFDGHKDLIAAPNADAYFKNFNQILVYKNHNTTECPDLQFEKDNFLVGNMVDLGTNAYPVLVDINGDSLLDILCGNFGAITPSNSYESRLTYIENIGSKTNPVYKVNTQDYLKLPFSQDSGLYPTTGDLDNDGDLDLLLGTDDGNIYFYENVAANPGDSVEWKYRPSLFDTVNFGKSIKPYLFDVNNDGLLDLLVGSQLSYLKLYKNIGSTVQPNFSNSSVIQRWGNISDSNLIGFGHLSVGIVDIDSTGKHLDSISDIKNQRLVFVGSSTGKLYLYKGLDSTGNSILSKSDELYLYTLNTSLGMGDITGDNKPDLIFGQQSGGISVLLKDGGNIIIPPKKEPEEPYGFHSSSSINQTIYLYPNPAKSSFKIKYDDSNDSTIKVQIVDMNGQVVLAQNFEKNQSVDISNLAEGSYWVSLLGIQSHNILKLVKIDH